MLSLMLSLLLSGALAWVIAGTSAADLATTEWALTKPGLAEANPLLQQQGPRVALKVAGTVVVISAYKELRRQKKHKAAKILAISVSALWAGAAVNNAIKAQRHR